MKWGEEGENDFKKGVEEGDGYKSAFVGSDSVGKEDGGWWVMVEDGLRKRYGDGIEVGIFEYGER